MKQQGWLPKIVPQPKEATTPCLFKEPWGYLVVAEQNPYLWYDEISMPSSNALGASHNASASSTTQKGGRESGAEVLQGKQRRVETSGSRDGRREQ